MVLVVIAAGAIVMGVAVTGQYSSSGVGGAGGGAGLGVKSPSVSSLTGSPVSPRLCLGLD